VVSADEATEKIATNRRDQLATRGHGNAPSESGDGEWDDFAQEIHESPDEIFFNASSMQKYTLRMTDRAGSPLEMGKEASIPAWKQTCERATKRGQEAASESAEVLKAPLVADWS
jgi:hypothetical protein